MMFFWWDRRKREEVERGRPEEPSSFDRGQAIPLDIIPSMLSRLVTKLDKVFQRQCTISLMQLKNLTASPFSFDIAGKGIADIGAFQAALRIAVRMALGPK